MESKNTINFSKEITDKVKIARIKVECLKPECKHFWTFAIEVIDGVAQISSKDLECQECKRDEEIRLKVERESRREQVLKEFQFS